MKKILILFSLVLIGIIGCKKDEIAPIETFNTSDKSGFKTYNWSATESKFFSLENDVNDKASGRSASSFIYHPLVIETYNEIASQNEEHHFVDSIVAIYGYPVWKKAYIYDNKTTNQNVVITPFVNGVDSKITGLISSTKTGEGSENNFVIEGISRQELLTNNPESGDYVQRCSNVKWLRNHEKFMFDEVSDPQLADQFCNCQNTDDETGDSQNLISSSARNGDGDWKIVEICTDSNTRGIWIGGMNNIPLDLDHDQDGIPNGDDQDWYDIMQSRNITQSQFSDRVRNWWDDHYQEDYGDYDDFWDDWDNGHDFSDIWDDISDVWDDFWDWAGDYFGGHNSYGDDLYYDPGDRDYGCYDNWLIGNKAESREVTCNWYYVLDCGDPNWDGNFNGNYWWYQFRESIQCDGCEEYADGGYDAFDNRLKNYHRSERLPVDVNFFMQLVDHYGTCQVTSPGFEECAQEILDNYFVEEITEWFEANGLTNNRTNEDLLSYFYRYSQYYDCRNLESCLYDIFEDEFVEAAIDKHNYLTNTYPNYAQQNININDFIENHGAFTYTVVADTYETYLEEVGETPPNDPYQWQLAMEVFREELLPVLAEFTPGIGDLIGAYNDFKDGNYFWGVFGIISTFIPGDELLKAWRKADNIRDGWKAVKKIFTLWNKLFTTLGGQKILNRMPQSWKDIPGSKLAQGDGLYWRKDTYNNLRIMDGNPNSPYPNSQNPYVRVTKNGSRLDKYGNPVNPNDPDFQLKTHIPLSEITDNFLDTFFN